MKSLSYFLLGVGLTLLVVNSKSNKFDSVMLESSTTEILNEIGCVPPPEVEGLSYQMMSDIQRASNGIHLSFKGDTIRPSFRSDVDPEMKKAVLDWYLKQSEYLDVTVVEEPVFEKGMPRITDQLTGSWSYVGITNLHPSLVGKPTMNFDRRWLTEDPNFVDRVVFHEEDHKKGYPHMQHHPDRCIQPDTAYLYSIGYTESQLIASWRIQDIEHFMNFPYEKESLKHYPYSHRANEVVNSNECVLPPYNIKATRQDTLMAQAIDGVAKKGVVTTEPTYHHAKGDQVLYAYHSGILKPAEVKNITVRSNGSVVYSVLPYGQKGIKHAFQDRVLKPSEIEAWMSSRKELLSRSQSIYVDSEQSEIDSLNLILRSLE